MPIMSGLPKIHKIPTGTRFIVASRKCSTKALSKIVTKAFKLFTKQTQSFHKKSYFHSYYKKFQVIDKLDHWQVSTFDLSTLYTKLTYKDLVKVLFYTTDFDFSGGSKKKKIILKKSFWFNKSETKSFFTKTSFKKTVQFCTENSYLTVGTVLLLQAVGIPIGIDPASSWANLYLYSFKSKCMTNLTRTNNLGGKRFQSSFYLLTTFAPWIMVVDLVRLFLKHILKN